MHPGPIRNIASGRMNSSPEVVFSWHVLVLELSHALLFQPLVWFSLGPVSRPSLTLHFLLWAWTCAPAQCLSCSSLSCWVLEVEHPARDIHLNILVLRAAL